jgi:hypothetical protein
MWEDSSSLAGLLVSILRGIAESLRTNKLATSLAAIAFVTTGILAFSSQYDERPWYRQVLLPDINRAESLFQSRMHDAEETTNENWRLSYFIDAQKRTREAVDLLKNRWPHTHDGMRAHLKLIQYHELLLEDFAIIRTQLSLDEGMDYMSAFRKSELERRPLRDAWLAWVNGK